MANLTITLAYKQKLKQKVPGTHSIQDCFGSKDWNMFWDSSDGIEEFTTSVSCFVGKCIAAVVPTVTVLTYPNQKPWITGNICNELMARAATFKERDTNPDAYKKSRHALRRTITDYKGNPPTSYARF